MPLLSFQLPVHAACLHHIHKKDRVEWPILEKGEPLQIHPPLIVNASVSSGKSRMIAELALAVKQAAEGNRKECRVLVIQRQIELAQQNLDAAYDVGVAASLFSAKRKSTYFDVVFATEGTVAKEKALQGQFTAWIPHLILIDEAHMVNFMEADTQFASILIHFYRLNPALRVIGYTGSPYRDQELIIGDTFWREYATVKPDDEHYPAGGVGDGLVTTEFMIREGWVVTPVFGWPEHEAEDSYAADFASLQTKAGSWEFDERQLDEATADVEKLYRILAEVIARSKDRKGVLIFGSTHKHLHQIAECLKQLGVPENEIGSITEKTGDTERKDILDRAKVGKCKYVLNVGVLTTGVNVPWWDTLVFLRPIGSLVLLIQSIGRVLRLLLEEGGPGMVEMDSMTAEERLALIAASPKPDALILDYAGVMDRLGEQYENPILEQAQKEHSARKGDLIQCPACAEMNSMFARRCIGRDHKGVRCEHFFQSKDCPDCGVKNDIVARECRNCGRELINPNEVLTHKHYTDSELTPVVSMKMDAGANGKLVVRFVLSDGREPYLIFYPNAGASPASIKVNQKVFWNGLVVPHIPPGEFRNKAYRMKADAVVKNAAWFNVPTHVAARFNEKTHRWVIGRRKFRDMAEMTVEGEE